MPVRVLASDSEYDQEVLGSRSVLVRRLCCFISFLTFFARLL